jgi:transcriptional regulator with XRE-family HTH domain
MPVHAFVKSLDGHRRAVAYDVAFGLGEAVATRRAQLHLSQVELSEATGIPQADISRIERGKGNPTLATVTRLLAALDLRFRIEPSQEVVRSLPQWPITGRSR